MSKHFYITLLCILTIGITLLVGAPFWVYIIIVVVYLGLLSWGVLYSSILLCTNNLPP